MTYMLSKTKCGWRAIADNFKMSDYMYDHTNELHRHMESIRQDDIIHEFYRIVPNRIQHFWSDYVK